MTACRNYFWFWKPHSLRLQSWALTRLGCSPSTLGCCQGGSHGTEKTAGPLCCYRCHAPNPTSGLPVALRCQSKLPRTTRCRICSACKIVSDLVLWGAKRLLPYQYRSKLGFVDQWSPTSATTVSPCALSPAICLLSLATVLQHERQPVQAVPRLASKCPRGEAQD